MANSKANIYPIQLQGAELNLNKYDAEIKQYSGFNKNNSPFVGGCLNNVFTKDEHLDAESESMYIDTNGDVYTVDESGLYKNNNLVIDFPEGERRFVDVEELQVPDGTLRVFAEGIYLLKKYYNNELWLFINDIPLAKYWKDYNDDENAFTLIDGFVDEVNNSSVFVIAYRCKVTGSGALIFRTLTSTEVDGKLIWNDTFDVNTDISISDEHFDLTLPTVITKLGNGTGNYLISTINNLYTEPSSSVSHTMCSNVYQVNVLNTNYTTFLNFNQNLNNNSQFSTEFKHCVFFRDCVIPISTPSNITGIRTDLNILFYLNLEEGELRVVDVLAVQFGSTSSPRSITTSVYTRGAAWFEATALVTHTPYVFSYDLFLQNETDEEYKTWACHLNNCSRNRFDTTTFEKKDISIDYKPQSIKTEKAVCSSGDKLIYYKPNDTYKYQLSFLNFKNIFIGISGKYCLFTDWNNTDESSISVLPQTWELKTADDFKGICVYRSQGKWFVIKRSVPKLNKVQNQLVVNIDYYNNSYDIKRNKVLYFGCDYNFVFNFMNSHFGLIRPVSNQDFIAAGRNVHKQEDNATIMLNPVAWDPFYESTIPSNNDYPDIEFYAGISGNIIYEGFNKDLIGLPYPIQTDGNVQYSPCLFSKIESQFGNQAFIKSGNTSYPLAMGNNNEAIMAYYLASGIENLDKGFIIQGQFYGLLNNGIYSLNFTNGVISDVHFIVDIANMQYVGNTPYMAIFFSKTNRCLYSFTGANVLNKLQFVDKISEIREYGYNPTTQTNILITDIGVIMLSAFGTFLLEYTDIVGYYLQDDGICLYNNNGDYHFIKYYKQSGDGYTKQNIEIETCFYGANNELTAINDCLYARIFSPEHEEGDLVVSASTLKLTGRQTEETTFKIKSSDWDKMTDSIYLRYQPKEQRGVGVSFKITSPFKIASLSVGSQSDAIMIDKVSKAAINSPDQTSNNVEW